MTYALFAAFLISCVALSICFNKKQTVILRAVILGVGVFVSVLSAFMLYIDAALICKPQIMQHLGTVVNYLLGISTIALILVALVVALAMFVLAALAIKKIVEYFKNKRNTVPKQGTFAHTFSEEIPFFIKKLFLLHCRLLD